MWVGPPRCAIDRQRNFSQPPGMSSDGKPVPAQPRQFNRKLVADLLRIQFHLSLVEVQIGVAGLCMQSGWLPDDPVFDLIDEQVFGPGERTEDVLGVFLGAWRAYRENFGSLEEFDPKPFVDWLAAGDFHSHPFKKKPRGLWKLTRVLPVV